MAEEACAFYGLHSNPDSITVGHDDARKANAIDGSTSTTWGSGSYAPTHWTGYWNTAWRLERIRLYMGSGDLPGTVWFEASNDGENWTLLRDLTGYNYNNNAYNYINISNEEEYHYYRLNSPYSDGVIWIYEIDFYHCNIRCDTWNNITCNGEATITASVSTRSGSKANLCDENVGSGYAQTYWELNSKGICTITWDLGSDSSGDIKQAVQRFHWYKYNDYPWPQTWVIEGSDDNQNWTTYLSYSGYPANYRWTNNGFNANRVAHRYWRWRSTDSYYPWYLRFYDHILGYCEPTFATVEVSLTEGVKIGEEVNALQILNLLFNEGAVVGEGMDNTYKEVFASLAEGVKVGEGIGDTTFTYFVTLAEGVNIGEVISAFKEVYVSLTEGVTASEAFVTPDPITGGVQITFQTNIASVTFYVKKPGVSITLAKPDIDFELK